ncbi:hypothetical protein [Amycolatopsis arida]|uniref:hypothetical protein n=1 Tax=Amycolatopsis arida TaxID=587909 RepID=UPI0010654CF7|nr:hypothetical protein [Amycolatopsis arida]
MTAPQRMMLWQVAAWTRTQRKWLATTVTSGSAVLETVLLGCVCLEEDDENELDPRLVEDYLVGLLRSTDPEARRPTITPRGRTILRLAARHGLRRLVDELDRGLVEHPPLGTIHAPTPPGVPDLKPQVVVDTLLRAVREHAAASGRSHRSSPNFRRLVADGVLDVSATISYLADRLNPPWLADGLRLPRIRRGGPAATLLAPHAFFRYAKGAGDVFHRPVPIDTTGDPDRDLRAQVLMIAHEVLPGHALHHQQAVSSLGLEHAAVLRDGHGVEGWAVWAEGLVSVSLPEMVETVLWFRVKRLLPLAMAALRHHRGHDAARRLLVEVARASPTLFTAAPAGHQLRVTNGAYGAAYLRTLELLGEPVNWTAPRANRAWLRAYLGAGGMSPERSAVVADVMTNPVTFHN